MKHEHTITLSGAAFSGQALSARLLRDLLDLLVAGAEQAVRLRIEGRSTAQGTPPGWLQAASSFDMVQMTAAPGSRVFRFEAPSLVETMAERFSQREMFDDSDLDPTRSALELFEDALAAALAGEFEEAELDLPLVKTLAGFNALFPSGLDSISIRNGRLLHVEPKALAPVVELSKQQFPERQVRVAGRLEVIRYSGSRFTLVLADGSKLAGVASSPEILQQHFGAQVAVTGRATFRPSGRMLRVEATSVEPATESDLQLFSHLAEPLLGAVERREEPVRKGGLGALFGKWPGDEPLEQLLAQLESNR